MNALNLVCRVSSSVYVSPPHQTTFRVIPVVSIVFIVTLFWQLSECYAFFFERIEERAVLLSEEAGSSPM